MSKSFVRPPVEESITNENGRLSEAWAQWFLDNWQSQDQLASEAGVQLPRLTTAQRDSNEFINQASIASGALNGLMIYNTSDNQVQAVVSSAWAAL